MFTRPRLALFTAATALAVTGCTSAPDNRDLAAADDLRAPALSPARLSVELGGARPVAPDQRVVVDVARGLPTQVTLTSRAGEELHGAVVDDAWTASEGLAPSTRYTLFAAASNADGDETRRRWSFRTASASTDLPAVTPLADATVGVGHPVIVYFDEDIADKAEVERHLTVDASRRVNGSWGWIDDRTVAYRPLTSGRRTRRCRSTSTSPRSSSPTVSGRGPRHRLRRGPLVRDERRRRHPPDDGRARRIGRADHPCVARQGRLHDTLRRQGDHDPRGEPADGLLDRRHRRWRGVRPRRALRHAAHGDRRVRARRPVVGVGAGFAERVARLHQRQPRQRDLAVRQRAHRRPGRHRRHRSAHRGVERARRHLELRLGRVAGTVGAGLTSMPQGPTVDTLWRANGRTLVARREQGIIGVPGHGVRDSRCG